MLLITSLGVEDYMPKVSVIIPCYNYANFLMVAIESVIVQTFTDWECIILDDGSTDNTQEIAQRYVNKDSRIRYIYQKNRGLASARNTGITNSQGEYIAFLDADDIWGPRKLSKQIFSMENNSSDLIHCKAGFIDEDGNEIPGHWSSKSNVSYSELLHSNLIAGSGSGVLVKKECFKRVGYFDESLPSLEDLNMWIRILKFFKNHYIDEKLVYIRRHNKSMQNDISTMEKAWFQHLGKSLDLMPELRPLKRRAKSKIYMNLAYIAKSITNDKTMEKYYLLKSELQYYSFPLKMSFWITLIYFILLKIKQTVRLNNE